MVKKFYENHLKNYLMRCAGMKSSLCVRSSMLLAFFLLFISVSPALAHFGMIIPSDPIIDNNDKQKSVQLDIKFLHPMEGVMMDMARPELFVTVRGREKADISNLLKEHRTASGLRYWSAAYEIKRPGDHVFLVRPQPYWEPAEDKFIIHLTKVCVNAFGMENGWDKPVGAEVEIVPLSRPYGLWTGNCFTGQVLKQGKPVPFAEIEVEYLNPIKNGKPSVTPPDAPFITQIIKADENGIFHYSMPRAGWWGFAALIDADYKIKKDGKDKDVELGAVYWVNCTDMK